MGLAIEAVLCVRLLSTSCRPYKSRTSDPASTICYIREAGAYADTIVFADAHYHDKVLISIGGFVVLKRPRVFPHGADEPAEGGVNRNRNGLAE